MRGRPGLQRRRYSLPPQTPDLALLALRRRPHPLPALFTAGAPGFIDTPSVAKPRAREGQGTDPLGLILTLFWQRDDTDRPVRARLRDILK